MVMDRKILIVGSDSVIGSSLMGALRRAGEDVVGTTRRPGSVDKTHLYLDLSVGVETWQCPFPVNVAILCASASKLETCKNYPLTTAFINVDSVAALVKYLIKSGVFVIYLSSNQVFDGSIPYRLSDDRFSPITEYGRQKAAVEQIISQWRDSISIVRFSKVLDSSNSLFSEWRDALKNNKVIHPFSDVCVSPVPLFYAISVLDFVRVNRLSGVLQVSGEVDIAYSDVAYRGAKLLDRNSSLVQPVKFNEEAINADRLPRYSTLNTERLKSALGDDAPDVWWTIEKAFLKPSALDNFINN